MKNMLNLYCNMQTIHPGKIRRRLTQKEVALKTAEEQQKGIKKLFIEDWKRV